jgi:aspartate dehydrogenase
MPITLGIIGFGHLGQYLIEKISSGDKSPSDFSLTFVWNRSKEPLNSFRKSFPAKVIDSLDELTNPSFEWPDMIIEVAHPDITRRYGELLVQHSDYFVGSPSVLVAEPELSARLEQAARASRHTIFVPIGALWGAHDIRRLAALNSITGLKLTFRKHPNSLKLPDATLASRNAAVRPEDGAVVLYEGSISELCRLAPNNVNSFAVAALCARPLPFEKVIARLVADCSCQFHEMTIEVEGPAGAPDADGPRFSVNTLKKNPAIPGRVTGAATYASFYLSLLETRFKRDDVLQIL